MIPGIMAGATYPAPPPAGGDPYWANVVSLLLLDEPAGATAIVDQRGVPWTQNGSAVMSGATSRFGSTSLYLPNSTGYDGFQTPAGLIPQSQPFTLEGWIFVTDMNGFFNGWTPLFGQGGGVGGGDQAFGLYSGNLVWLRGAGLPGGQVAVLGATAVTANQWHHIELGFDGTRGYLFLDGVLDAQIADTFGWINTGPYITIGRELVYGYEAYRLGMRGYIGSTRITSGVCRHTESFAPPTEPFPVG